MHFIVNKVERKYILELTRWGNNWILSTDIWLDFQNQNLFLFSGGNNEISAIWHFYFWSDKRIL